MVKMSACRAVTEWVRLPYRPQMNKNVKKIAVFWILKKNFIYLQHKTVG